MEYFRLRQMLRKLIATTLTVAAKIPKLAATGGLCAATMAFALAIAVPARAQITIQIGGPQVPGFSNDYPWFNEVPQYEGDQSFRYFMAYHPDIAQSLSQNPALLYNADWRAQFPALEQYLSNHPYEWQALNGEYWSEGPAETQWGDYDDGQWRDAYWWHQHNPNWFYDNHSDWASLDSRWLNEDGAYDQQNQWHYGEWWYNQDASWVTSNHPAWLRQHQNWQAPAEQQNYRQHHAMIQENQQQRNLQPQQANVRQQNQERTQPAQQASREQPQATQQEQLRATEQRQASLEQQQTMRQEDQRQEQMNRQQNQERQQASREQPQAMHQENRQAQPQQREQQATPREQPQRQEQSADQQHGNGEKRSQ